MLLDSVKVFSETLHSYLINESKITKGLLVKKHNENLLSYGDFSFPNTALLSYHIANCDKNDKSADEQNVSSLEFLAQKKEAIVRESIHWILHVANIKENRGRSYLYLQRPPAISLAIKEIASNNLIILKELAASSFVSYAEYLTVGTSHFNVDHFILERSDLTSLRALYCAHAVWNLSTIFNVKCPILITTDSKTKSSTRRILLMGPVLNAETGKLEENIQYKDYVSIRQQEIRLIALNRYGARLTSEPNLNDIMQLGESAVVFELLQTKANKPTKINFNPNFHSNKGALFMLYNCARLETLLVTFESAVRSGLYPPLPDHDDIDFSLLADEDEWSLIFNFVLGLPSALTRCVDINIDEEIYEFRPHHMCTFLNAMVRVFSSYYRRVRILTEPRSHLLPVMFARIHMLKALSITFQICLKILHIPAVKHM